MEFAKATQPVESVPNNQQGPPIADRIERSRDGTLVRSKTYWLQDHVDNLEQLVLYLDLKNITVVMHDFGGPTGMGLAIRHPDRIARVIAINTAMPFGQEDLATRVTENAKTAPWFRWILKASQEGTLETVLGQLGHNILSTLSS